MSRVVIVGGGGTGDAAAFALRKRGFDGEILILSADRDRPYDRPYLSKEFLRSEVELPKVFLHEEADYVRERIDLRLASPVIGGSLRERTVTVSAGEVAFDVLVLGLGGTPRRPQGLPSADNVLTLRSLRDSQALSQALGSSKRLLMIGAGFIGAEVAASARKLGKEVIMVVASRHRLPAATLPTPSCPISGPTSTTSASSTEATRPATIRQRGAVTGAPLRFPCSICAQAWSRVCFR